MINADYIDDLCPFCLSSDQEAVKMGPRKWVVRCPCGAQGPIKNALWKAVVAWNHRPAFKASKSAMKELQAEEKKRSLN